MSKRVNSYLYDKTRAKYPPCLTCLFESKEEFCVCNLPCLFRACNEGYLSDVFDHEHLNFPGPKVANNGASALYIACCSAEDIIVEVLVESQQFDVNRKNYKGFSPLYAACRKNNIKIVQTLLLDPRLDINSIWVEGDNGVGSSNKSPLSFCSRDIQMLFLKHKSFDINRSFVYYIKKKWKKGGFLHYALEKNDLRMLKVILEHPNIDPNLRDIHNKTPLARTIEKRNLSMLKMVLEHPDTNPNLCSNGFSPLVEACFQQKKQNIGMFGALFLHPKTRLDIIFKGGKTFLHQLLQYRKSSGLDAAIRLSSGHTNITPNTVQQVFHILNRYPDINLNIVDDFGRTPFTICNKQYEFIERCALKLEITRIGWTYNQSHWWVAGVRPRNCGKFKQQLMPFYESGGVNCPIHDYESFFADDVQADLRSVSHIRHAWTSLLHEWGLKDKRVIIYNKPVPRMMQMLYVFEMLRQKELPHDLFIRIMHFI